MSEFRPGLGLRLGNRVLSPIIRAGFPIGLMALLTVEGRKSGLPRTTPVAVAELQRGLRLVAPYGETQWVKNLRAAGFATLTRRRRTIEVRAIELSAAEAAPQLRQSLAEAGFIVRRVLGGYFQTSVDAGLDEWEKEASAHPVFILEPVTGQAMDLDPSRSRPSGPSDTTPP